MNQIISDYGGEIWRLEYKKYNTGADYSLTIKEEEPYKISYNFKGVKK